MFSDSKVFNNFKATINKGFLDVFNFSFDYLKRNTSDLSEPEIKNITSVTLVYLFYYYGKRYNLLLPLDNEMLCDFLISLFSRTKSVETYLEYGALRTVNRLITYEDIENNPIDNIKKQINTSISLDDYFKQVDNMMDLFLAKVCTEFDSYKYALIPAFSSMQVCLSGDNIGSLLSEMYDLEFEDDEIDNMLFDLLNECEKASYKESNNLLSDISGLLDGVVANLLEECDANYDDYIKYNFKVTKKEILTYNLKLLILSIKHGEDLSKIDSLSLVDECFSDKCLKELISKMTKGNRDNYDIYTKTVFHHYKYFNGLKEKYGLNNFEVLVMSVMKDLQEYDINENTFGEQMFMIFSIVFGGATMIIDTKKEFDFNAYIPEQFYNTAADDLFRAVITATILSQALDSRGISLDFIMSHLQERASDIFVLCLNLIDGSVPDMYEDSSLNNFAEDFDEKSFITELKEMADQIIGLFAK